MRRPTRERRGPIERELVDVRRGRVTLAWGRSVFGCSGCGDAAALAGFELKVDGRLLERLCGACARLLDPDKLAARAKELVRG